MRIRDERLHPSTAAEGQKSPTCPPICTPDLIARRKSLVFKLLETNF